MNNYSINNGINNLNIITANARKRILNSHELITYFINQYHYNVMIMSEYHDQAIINVKNNHICTTKRSVKGQEGILICYDKSLNITRAHHYKKHNKIKSYTDYVIMIGGVNERHTYWGDKLSNIIGKCLYEKIIEHDLYLANIFGVSTYHDENGCSSVIDLTLHTDDINKYSPTWSIIPQIDKIDHELIEVNLHDLEWLTSSTIKNINLIA
ncbi:unnamed protein product, partial [Didymodactylos carnosus]